MTDKPKVSQREDETRSQALARVSLTPECLSASVLMASKAIRNLEITEVVDELRRQTAAINRGDMTRAVDMLLAQAHTLDGLFAKLASQALSSQHMDVMEAYMRLALKAQNQARATLQTLAELKAPRQVAFVQQANIGNQVQVNNGTREQSERARKKPKTPNELLEVRHGERLDTRAAGTAGGVDSAMAAVEAEHRPQKPPRQGRSRT
jgi:hypothetical protein